MYYGQRILYTLIHGKPFEVSVIGLVLSLHVVQYPAVLDFLASGEAPQQLLVHPLIQLCLAEAWIHGQHDSHEDESATLSRLFHFIDGTGAPQ